MTLTVVLVWLVNFSVALLAAPIGPGGVTWTLRRCRAHLGHRSASTSSAQARSAAASTAKVRSSSRFILDSQM